MAPLLNASEGAVRPLSYRSVSQGEVALLSLVGRRWRWAGIDSGHPRVISIDRVLPSSDLPVEQAASFEWQGVEFAVIAAPNLFQALCGFDPWLGQSEGEPLIADGVSWRLRDVLAVLNNLWFSNLGGWIRPVSEFRWEAGSAGLMALECSTWSDEGLWLDRFWLVPLSSRAPLEGLPALLRASGLQERAVANHPAIPLVADAVVGEVSMPISSLRSLAVGDAVIFAHANLQGLDQLDVSFGAGRMRFRILDSVRLELAQPVEFLTISRGKPMEDEFNMGDLSIEVAQPARGGEGAAKDALRDIPVRLAAVAGSIRLTVADLARLKVGDCVDLERPAQPYVRLVANGKDIGLGELVDVDGKLGVQITRLDIES